MSDSPIPQMDLAWVLVSAGMVFLMQAGFLALEAGLTRTKNAINVAIKNITDFGLSLVLFWAVGFGLIFSPSLGGFIGSGLWIPNHQSLGHDGTAFLLFQGMFCGTAVTIVAGAVAERMRFGAYLVVAVLTSAFIYPVAAHWSWGGTEEGGLGWLRALGFVDFAGSGVVHAVGGAIALAAVLVLGPRIGRFSDEGAVRIPPSSLPMAMLGVMILWFGWIGFNGGSHLMMDEAVPRIILNTMLAGSAGLVSALITSHSRLGYAEPSAVICGSLGGLVSVTASCNVIDFSSAVLIGAVGGIVAVQACRWLERFNIDDAVDAIPVHLACGVWGTLAYGIFAPVGELAVDGGRAQQILVQAGGTLALTFSAFAFSYVTLRAINALFPLRVTPDAEEQGLNVAEHNAPSAMQDLLEAMDTQSAQRDLSLRAPVEPFTEIGKVAHRYNALMATLEGSLTSIAELEEAQAKLEAAREHAVEALETRSLFVANMSHELRTPMNAIIGFADLLLEEDFEPEETDEFLTLIKSSGAHLLELINDVLDLSKLEAGKLEIERLDFELIPLIRECVAQLSPRARKSGIKLTLNAQPQAAHQAHSDPTRVRQVLLNLLSNAVKFTETGSVTVDVRAIEDDDSFEIAVTDTGIGLTDDRLEAIFEEFTQANASTTRRFGGTGLGLSLSKRIAMLLGGDITVESEVGVGSTFRFRFAADAAAHAARPAAHVLGS